MTAERIKKMGDFIIEVMKKGNLSQAYIIGRNAGLYLKAKYPGMFLCGWICALVWRDGVIKGATGMNI